MTGPEVESVVPVADDDDGEFVEDILDEGSPEDETDSPTQPPETGTPPAAPAAPAAPTGQTAQPRKPDGTFAPKGDEPAPGGPAADTAAPAAEAPTAPTTEGAAESAAKPYTFRAEGTDYQVPGATINPDGSLTIPKEQVAEVSTYLSEGVHHRKGWRQQKEQLERRVAEAEQRGVYEVTHAKETMGRLTAMVEDHVAGKVGEDGRSALTAFLEDTATEWPRLQLEAERRALQSERDTFQAGRAGEQQQVEDTQLNGALEHHVTEIAAQFPGVDPARVLAKLRAGGVRSYFFRADRDIPEAQLRKGDIGVKLGAIAEEFKFAAEVAQQARAAAAAAAEQEKKNRQAVAASPAPPAVPAAGSAPAPGAKEEIPKFASREERDRWYADRARRHARGE